MTRQYTVTPADPRRVAAALVRCQVRQPRFWVPLAAMVAVLALLGWARFGGTGAVAAVLFLGVVVAGVIAFRQRKLRPALATYGFRPGSVLTAEFDDAQVSISNEAGAARHSYTDIADARLVGGVVVLRLRDAGLLVALPRELVPDDVRARLATSEVSTAVGPGNDSR